MYDFATIKEFGSLEETFTTNALETIDAISVSVMLP